MSNINDGGPAFPVTTDNYNSLGSRGLSIRDYFAAKAMSGLLERVKGNILVEPERIAFDAYVVADAMLKARGRHD